MSRDLLRRIQRLEATRAPQGRYIAISVSGDDREEMDAEVEAQKRAKGVTENDFLVVIRTTYDASRMTGA